MVLIILYMAHFLFLERRTRTRSLDSEQGSVRECHAASQRRGRYLPHVRRDGLAGCFEQVSFACIRDIIVYILTYLYIFFLYNESVVAKGLNGKTGARIVF